jgi:hypothetical protein
MKIFISWSGERSHAVAQALRDWLPDVVQALEPWLSSTDIDAGTRWTTEIATKLEATSFGVLCLTRDNTNAPWVLFEAGALSKMLESSRVCPYVVDFELSELRPPLNQFHAVQATKGGTLVLLQSINRALGERALSDGRLLNAFERYWPDLKTKLEALPADSENSEESRSDRVLLLEMLDLLKVVARRDEQRESYERAILGTMLTSHSSVLNSGVMRNNLHSREETDIARAIAASEAVRVRGQDVIISRAGEPEFDEPITIEDVRVAIQETCGLLSPFSLEMDAPIRTAGIYPVVVRLHPDVSVPMKVWALFDREDDELPD